MLTNLRRPSRDSDGFTLIELLVVVIIIGLLAAIALPIFLNQQKAAVDAAVKSDVRNTAANVQGWRVDHRLVAAANTTAYKEAGGVVTQSRASSVLGVVAKADGSYTVCAYDGSGNNYAKAEQAWAFDSSTGKFSLSTSNTCEGAVAADGTDISYTAVAPKFTTAALPNATQDTFYTTTLAASGKPAATFELATGSSLPAGLDLNKTTGVISGTPTGTGVTSVSLVAKNRAGSDSLELNLTVLSKDAKPTFTSSQSAPDATYNVKYPTFTLAADGYPKPTFDVANGYSLPLGLTLDKASGAIDGTPTISGRTTVRFVAINRAGVTPQDVVFTVNQPVAITTGAPTANVTANDVYSFFVRASGYPAPKFSATGLPTGLSIDQNTGEIKGQPTVAGTYSNVMLTAKGANTVDAGPYTITVKPSTVSSGLEATETAQNANWTYGTGAARTNQENTGSIGAVTARTGTYYVVLKNAYSNDVNPVATYKAPTAIGQKYTLSVWLRVRGGYPDTTTISVAGASQSVSGNYSNYDSGWVQKTFTFTATATTTPVVFNEKYNFYSPYPTAIDDLGLTPQ